MIWICFEKSCPSNSVGNGIDEGDVSFDSLLEMMTDTVKAAIDEVLEGRRKIAESLEPHQAGQAPCR